ncbi:MAG: hypothetical protein GWN00_05110, partial [Aliifodinibius sp.]|nr:hypothetical protein [Fodinibius sp.]NIV10580.1 hypothetical protein [Fodinibius sp.]NIY24208.1 hypothetical protein [Fodinibius sp.]
MKHRKELAKNVSSVFVNLLVVCASICLAEDRNLFDFLAAGNENNKSSIHSATGSAIVTFERIVHSGDGSVLNRLGRGGIESRKVQWFVSEDNRRVDEESTDIPEGKQRFTLPRKRETAWSPDKRIYFHHFQKFPPEAYINKPWRDRFKFVRGVTTYFDPMLFFNIGEYSSLEKIYKKFSSSLSVSAKGVGDNQLYIIHGEDKSRDELTLTIELQIAPNKGYNVTKMRAYSSLYPEGPIMELDATYTDGGTNGGSYFPKTYHYRTTGRDITETVDVEFSDVVINKPVDPKVFTFEGMGVPAGTKLIDMRYGDHIHSYYKGLPAEQLDILTKDIIEEKWSELSPSSSVNDSNNSESLAPPAPLSTDEVVNETIPAVAMKNGATTTDRSRLWVLMV